mmetsp:Transcript_70712/g.133507  ORF Transcript_70712/g.133507 Transcript_70712/m.133507 type:complete len:124 (-) Transcript_70712:51-422(-)
MHFSMPTLGIVHSVTCMLAFSSSGATQVFCDSHTEHQACHDPEPHVAERSPSVLLQTKTVRSKVSKECLSCVREFEQHLGCEAMLEGLNVTNLIPQRCQSCTSEAWNYCYRDVANQSIRKSIV